MMKNKIIILISLIFIVSLISIPSAEAGIIDDTIEWFRELFGISSNVISISPTTASSIIDFDKNHKLIDKIEEKDNIEVRDTFEIREKETKHTINIKNKGLTDISNYKYSTIIEIKEEKILWNGTEIQLGEIPVRLQYGSYNIFFGKENRRINFKDIGEKGGYALASIGKIELVLDKINLKVGVDYEIDPTYINQTDGFSTLVVAGSTEPNDITTNGTDLWWCDNADNYIYHATTSGINKTGFSTLPLGSTGCAGITKDATGFWIGDLEDGVIYHTNLAGANQSTSIQSGRWGNGDPRGVTTNGSDFWATDNTDNRVYHYYGNRSGDKIEWLTTPFPSDVPMGITTNGTDLWWIDQTTDYISHSTLTGTNLTDGINTVLFGVSSPSGITTDALPFLNGGTPENFWIVDDTDNFVHHIYNLSFHPPTVDLISPVDNSFVYYPQANLTFNVTDQNHDSIDNCSLYIDGVLNETDTSITAGIYQTFNKSMDYGETLWIIGCWDVTNRVANSSEYNFTRRVPTPIVTGIYPTEALNLDIKKINFTYNVTTPTGVIDSCNFWYNDKLNKTDSSIEEGVNQTFNITIGINYNNNYTIECINDVGLKANSTLINFVYNTVPTTPNILSPANNTLIAGSSVILTCNGSTDPENTVNYEFFGGNSVASMAFLQNSTSTNFTWSGLNASSYYWNCRSNDNFSHSAYTDIRTLTSIAFYANCSGENSTAAIAYNFSFKSESNTTSIKLDNVTYEAWFTMWGSDQTVNNTLYSDLVVKREILYCISPVNATFTANAMIEYVKPEYDVRNYYLRGATVDNETDHISLYLLPILLGDGITIHVIDEFEQDIQDVYIQIQRYDVGTDSYNLVAMGRTDTNGEDYIFLRKFDAWYRFVLIKDGEIVFTSDPMKIALDTIEFKVIPETLGETYEKFGNVQASLTFNNDTKYYILTYADITGASRTHNLQVFRRTAARDIFICDEEQTAASGVMTCYIGNSTGIHIGNYYATGGSPPIKLLLSRIVETRRNITQLMGLDGVFVTFLITGVLSFVGLFNPVVAITLCLVGIIVSFLLGFMAIGFGAIVGLVVVGIIIIVKLNRK